MAMWPKCGDVDPGKQMVGRGFNIPGRAILATAIDILEAIFKPQFGHFAKWPYGRDLWHTVSY